jgi:hypothetical protein
MSRISRLPLWGLSPRQLTPLPGRDRQTQRLPLGIDDAGRSPEFLASIRLDAATRGDGLKRGIILWSGGVPDLCGFLR